MTSTATVHPQGQRNSNGAAYLVEVTGPDGATAGERLAYSNSEVADAITAMGYRQVAPWGTDEDGRATVAVEAVA